MRNFLTITERRTTMNPTARSCTTCSPVRLGCAGLGLVATLWSSTGIAATGTVSCTLFVGGKPADTQTVALDDNGSARKHLVFEANMYTADVEVTAIDGQVKAGMTLRQEGSQQSGSYNDYSALTGVAPGPASQVVTVLNAKLACELS